MAKQDHDRVGKNLPGNNQAGWFRFFSAKGARQRMVYQRDPLHSAKTSAKPSRAKQKRRKR